MADAAVAFDDSFLVRAVLQGGIELDHEGDSAAMATTMIGLAALELGWVRFRAGVGGRHVLGVQFGAVKSRLSCQLGIYMKEQRVGGDTRLDIQAPDIEILKGSGLKKHPFSTSQNINIKRAPSYIDHRAVSIRIGGIGFSGTPDGSPAVTAELVIDHL